MTQNKFTTGQWSEVRVTDPLTGGQKGDKIGRFDLIPPEALGEVAAVYGRGAKKYAPRNWELGYDWGLSVAALERHLQRWKAGEQRDEMDNHHLACVVFHALALITFEKFGLGTDTRSQVGRETQGSIDMANGLKIPTTWSASYSFPVDGNGSVVDEEVSTQGMELNQTTHSYPPHRRGMVFGMEKK
jgi:hypothetical protein